MRTVKKRSRAASSDIESLPQKKIKKSKKESIEETPETNIEENLDVEQEKTFFQKGDYSRYHTLPTSLKDNTFEAKFKYGNGDEYGKIGHQKLFHTRGKDFKKEKNKLKNKGFIGGSNLIDIHKVNAIKL